MTALPAGPRVAERAAVPPRPRTSRFVADSPLEQSGFEPPVPRAVEERCRNDKLRSRAMVRWLVWGALPCPLRSRWDREFESPLLQRRVSLSRDFFFVGQEPRLSARVCRAAFLARSAAASLRRSRLTSSPSSQSIDYPRYCASYLVALTLGPGNPTIAPRPSSTIPTAVTAWQLP
jgi:hypothetical protein